jgi:DNA-binding transcriptional LysR family regulator
LFRSSSSKYSNYAGFLPCSHASRARQKVRVAVQFDRTVPLIEKTMRGELDIAFVWSDGATARHSEKVADVPIHRVGRPDWAGIASLAGELVPLIAFAPPCVCRSAAVEALDAAGLPWRLVFNGPNVSGLCAAAEGGLGVTVRTTINLPKTLDALDAVKTGLPALSSIPLALGQADAHPPLAAARMSNILLDTLRNETGFVR